MYEQHAIEMTQENIQTACETFSLFKPETVRNYLLFSENHGFTYSSISLAFEDQDGMLVLFEMMEDSAANAMCGNDNDEPIFPEFSTIEEILELKEDLET